MKASKGKSIRSGPYSSGSGKGKEPDEGRMLSVSGIPFKAEWQEIKDHMGQAGTVEFAEHLIGNDGRPKGVAFVRYSTQEEAQNAIETLTGTFMPGKDGQPCSHKLEVDLWTGAKPKTTKGGAKGGGSGMGWKDEMMMNMMAMMNPGLF